MDDCLFNYLFGGVFVFVSLCIEPRMVWRGVRSFVGTDTEYCRGSVDTGWLGLRSLHCLLGWVFMFMQILAVNRTYNVIA
jgi:hypothetical protein